jgi:type II secretory pathway component PulK
MPRRNGFVLVSVLWILAILTVISLGFAHRAMLERRMAWYALDREQAQQMARAAAERGLFELESKFLLDDYNDQAGYTGLDQRWARPIDLLKESQYFQADRKDMEGDVCQVRIEDAERYISINHVQREVLESVEGMSRQTVSRILDTREQSTPGLQPALFHSVEEVREMQRFSDEIWSGRPGKPGLVDLLTVWGDPAYGRINLNTASEAVLLSLPDIEDEVVAAIMEYRNGPDGKPYTQDDRSFLTIGLASSKLEISLEKLAPVNRFCKTDSRFFTITAHASRRRGKINAYCTVTVELRGATPVVLAWKEGAVGA